MGHITNPAPTPADMVRIGGTVPLAGLTGLGFAINAGQPAVFTKECFG
ncbi:hypothetical protein GCM10011415_26500 [Salipiger pallidus]|uniref:Uncharacterized protein n=1 Tax=Salipiger pallidus TaxID=1775170 RepID=A0A8J2ZKQ7_9RHOB|nr:hypothetical protein [Salipiger pallidus]GGG76473.1 hypothetical protein GCM10011415_26500 [Salipiger pallidus]